MANDFLSSLFANQQNIPSPMLTEDELVRKKAKEDQEAEDAWANMPAEELEETPVARRTPQLATPEEVAQMAQYERSPFEEAQAATKADRQPASQIEKEVSNADQIEQGLTDLTQKTQQSPISQYQDLLNAYRNLKPAQEQYQQQLGNIAMLQGANQMAQGFARGYGADIGTGEAGIKALQQQAAQPIEAIGQQIQMGKSQLGLENELKATDPNSDISKFAREQAAKVMATKNGELDSELQKKYTDQFSGMSAADLEKMGFKGAGATGILTPYQQMMMEINKSKIENQKEALKQGAERMGLSKEKIQNTLDTALSKEGQSLGKSIDAMDKTTRNGLGRAAASLMASTELETLIKAKPMDKLDHRDMEEVARIVNNMLTQGGSTAVSSIQALVPDTYKGSFAKFKEKLTNEPQSVEAQEFVKGYLKLAQKQKTKSMTDIDAIVKSRLPEFYRLKKEKPDEFNNIVNAKINALNIMAQSPETSQQTIPEIKPYTGTQESGMMKKESKAMPGKIPSGKIHIIDSDGQEHYLPKENLEAAKKRDPGLKVIGE